ncbi:unnamed protein product [Gongylonema pulchrum]|uniref:DUF4283 domain-containing protein n=1 Tax=Gongylonema pulchrum TaxID=637853 RepID=A0A183DN05_9BILA|nr:unnamed protein product [Gongylonema pulchrum]
MEQHKLKLKSFSDKTIFFKTLRYSGLIRFWNSHALNLVIASLEKTFGTFRLFAPVDEPPPLPVFPSLNTDSLPPSSFNEPHIDNDSSPVNTRATTAPLAHKSNHKSRKSLQLTSSYPIPFNQKNYCLVN